MATSSPPTPSLTSSLAPTTHVAFYHSHPTVFNGGFIKFYNFSSPAPLFFVTKNCDEGSKNITNPTKPTKVSTLRLLDDRVHGSSLDTSPALVFGHRSLRIIEIDYDTSSSTISLSTPFSPILLPSAIWFLKVLSNKIYVATAHNAIQVYSSSSLPPSLTLSSSSSLPPSPLITLNNEIRCITYSMAINDNLDILSGTVFNEVLIWSATSLHSSTSSTSSSIIKNKHKLKGHEGVIFRVAWGENNEEILSCSDDRSVRLWCYDNTTDEWSQRCPPPSPHIVTSGEDGTARVWCCDTGKLLSVIEGHGAKSIWRIAIDPNNSDRVVTGGNDSVGKGWSLDWVTQHCNPDSALEYDLECDFPAPPAALATPPEMEEPPPPPSDDLAKTETATKKKKKKKRKKPKPLKTTILSTHFLPPPHNNTIISVSTTGLLYKSELNTSDSSSNNNNNNILLLPHPPTATNVTATAVHPSSPTIAVGTSNGSIVISDVSSTPTNQQTIIPGVPNYFSVLSLTYLPCSHPPSLVSSHTLGRFLQINPSTGATLRAFEIMTIGVASAFCFAPGVGIFTGDSRGNLFFFESKGGEWGEEHTNEDYATVFRPSSIARNLHKTAHVTAIHYTQTTRTAISIGHDAAVQTTMLTSSNHLKPCVERSVAFASALTTLTVSEDRCKNQHILVGGYHADTYVLFNLTTHCTLLKFNCGSWKRPHDISFTLSDDNSQIEGAIAVVNNRNERQKNAAPSPSPMTPFLKAKRITPAPQPVTFGERYHGRTVHCASLFEWEGGAWCISGSEDCSVKLGRITSSSSSSSPPSPNSSPSYNLFSDLSSFDSCVRACASSTGEKTALLTLAGGKLELAMYILEGKGPSVSMIQGNQKSYEKNTNTEIDHRMNAVASIHLGGDKFLVATGDSRGKITIFKVEKGGNISVLEESVKGLNSRPILCLDLVIIDADFVILTAGNTAGVLGVFKIDLSSSSYHCSLKHEFKPHSMGCNSVSTSYSGSKTSKDLTIVTGGDDQALHCSIFKVHNLTVPLATETVPNASSSALKSVMLSKDNDKVYAVGYDQVLKAWEMVRVEGGTRGFANVTGGDILSLVEGGKERLNVTDVSDGSVLQLRKGSDLVVVVGDGLEVVKVSSGFEEEPMERAAKALSKATHLLVTAGAGMGKDAGLPTFEDLNKGGGDNNYKSMCDPIKLVEEREEFMAFWEQMSSTYENTNSHAGYEALNRMAKNVGQAYCYTSNVDGHFRRLDAFNDNNEKNLCEIHGYAGEWRCAAGMGKVECGGERLGETWQAWNAAAGECNCEKQDELFPCGTHKCKNCGFATRPNVLMFNDSDENVLAGIRKEREKYQQWEAEMEASVCGSEKKSLVVLELGCGVAVPSCRHEGYEVMRDVAKGGGKVTFIRVNVKDAGHDEVDLDLEAAVLENVVSLGGVGAEEVLLEVEARMRVREEEGGGEEETRELLFDEEWEDNKGVIGVFGEYTEDDEVVEKERLEREEKGEEKGEEEGEGEGEGGEGGEGEEEDSVGSIVEEMRALEFEDNWGDNEDGVKSKFGEFKDDEDVIQKHLKEEDEEEERRLEEEARELRRVKEEEEAAVAAALIEAGGGGGRELVFDDF
ncbi:hypothetical protein TrLO_g15590 [Triparma laevis f. longispina]|uniref:Deacetylase sirtuin-type domain-containing protein n=1 Tax=Triparma laevis f. longispina TaxID=1714387 RepID=A0A9W7FDK7_9STRA|nr:hypothetical protein TrLO_g15590 [Triparma laevis f. longispina]